MSDVPDDIFRSGVPHAVETNLVTRHAINPRHTFNETDGLPSQQAPDSPPPPIVARSNETDTHTPHVPKDAWQDNIQSLGKAHHTDNLQALPSEAFVDNVQSVGAAQSIQEKKLYLEKKSIKDNVQKVVETAVMRAAPSLPHAKATPPSGTALVSPPKVRGNPTRQTQSAEKATAASRSAQEDDALRARMQKLKATVRDVKDTLSDLEPKA